MESKQLHGHDKNGFQIDYFLKKCYMPLTYDGLLIIWMIRDSIKGITPIATIISNDKIAKIIIN